MSLAACMATIMLVYEFDSAFTSTCQLVPVITLASICAAWQLSSSRQLNG